MKYVVVDPKDYPLKPNESWFVVSPNNAECKFDIPEGSLGCCTKDFMFFREGTLYIVASKSNGWITVAASDGVVKMPEYIYARHFDAETYVSNRNILPNPSRQGILVED